MPISRRGFLVAAAVPPALGACATDLSRYADEPLPGLAVRLGVCAADYVTLSAGRPGTPVHLSGCSPPRPIGGEAIFQAASLTKPLVAFAALKLARQGLLDLHAPVSRYLPDGYARRRNPFGAADDRRIDQVPVATLARLPVVTLLNHSSGLPNWTKESLSPAFEPGTRWQYSGEGYVLLQAVITAATGQGIEALVSKTVFEPLDMRHSRLRLTDDISARVVGGTSWFGGSRRFDFREPNAAASLYTTAADYARLLAAWLADAQLLQTALSHRVPAAPQLGLAWGCGWGIETASGGPYLWQWGNNPGYRAFAMVSAASGNGFVLFTNSERGLALAAALARSTIPADHGAFRFHMVA